VKGGQKSHGESQSSFVDDCGRGPGGRLAMGAGTWDADSEQHSHERRPGLNELVHRSPKPPFSHTHTHTPMLSLRMN